MWADIIGDEERAKRLQKNDKNIWNWMLQVGLHVELGSTVYNKNIPELIRRARLRFAEVQKSPFHSIVGKLEKIDPNALGIYRMVADEGGNNITHIEHVIASARADLRDIGHPIDATWTISTKNDVLKARLGKGKLNMLVHKLFDREVLDTAVFKPQNLTRVPSSPGGGNIVGGQRGDGGDPTAAAASGTASQGAPPPAGSRDASV